MKNKHIKLILLSIISVLFVSCVQEEVQSFKGDRGVIFLKRYATEWNAYVPNIEESINFFDSISTKGFPIEYVELPMRLDIEGRTPDKPLKVRFKTVAIEDYDMVKVEIPEVEFQPGKAEVYFTAKIYHPNKFNKELGCRVVVDYENSDVIPGSKEYQTVDIYAYDRANMSAGIIYLPEEDFMRAFEDVFGKYGNIKHRFCVANAPKGAKFNDRAAYTAYRPDMPDYGLPALLPTIKEKLEKYNSENPNNPLKEEDGTLITFP